jgi:hypothetical protein
MPEEDWLAADETADGLYPETEGSGSEEAGLEWTAMPDEDPGEAEPEQPSDFEVLDDAEFERHSIFKKRERKPNFVLTVAVRTVQVMAVVILLAYTFLQGERRKLRFQLPGALFTTVMWLAFSRLFELFIQRFWQASSLYGSLAAIFLAAMWLKSMMMILFYGAALNEALNRRRGPDGKVLFELGVRS